jgi:transposase
MNQKNNKAMNHIEYNQIIAVDVAKNELVTYDGNRLGKIANKPGSFEKLLADVNADTSELLVVCEATGSYERPLVNWLQQRDIAVHIANPARVRAFAKGKGIQLKNDPVDAKVLMLYAIENKVVASRVPTDTERQITALLDRRSHLSRELTREKNRLEKEPDYTSEFIVKSIEFIKEQIAQIHEQIKQLSEQDKQLKENCDLFSSIKGVGHLTAITVLTYMPEIATVSRNQAVALAGLAPYDRDTGTVKGRRFIQGGRAKIRRCLYMAAVSAARFNPVIRDYVARLIARGKPFKCAIVAAMRKLIIHMHSQLKQKLNEIEKNAICA